MISFLVYFGLQKQKVFEKFFNIQKMVLQRDQWLNTTVLNLFVDKIVYKDSNSSHEIIILVTLFYVGGSRNGIVFQKLAL